MATQIEKNSSAGASNKVTAYVNQQLEVARRQVKSTDLIGGFLTVLAIALGMLLIAAFWDGWINPLSEGGRWFCLFVLLGTCLTYGLTQIAPLFLKRINPDYAARMIEQSKPGFKNSLLNYVALRRRTEEVNPAVFNALARQAAEDLKTVPSDATVDRSKLIRLGFILVALTVFTVGYKMLSPKDPLQSFARVLIPSARIAQPARVHISDIKPGDLEVYFGDQVDVSAIVRGKHLPSDVSLVISTPDGQLVNQRIPMEPEDLPNRYRATLGKESAGLQQSLMYRIEALDGVSPEFEIIVKPNPTIAIETLTLVPPKYTRLPTQTQVGQGEINALEGTKIVAEAIANAPIREANLDLMQLNEEAGNNPFKPTFRTVESIPMEVEGLKAKASFWALLNRAGEQSLASHYQLRFTTISGDRNQKPNVYPIKVTPDLAPEIRVLSPRVSEVSIPADDSLAIDVEANDLDFEISEVQFNLHHQGRLLAQEKINCQPINGPQRVKGRFVLQPSQFRLRAGDTAIFFLTAADNRTVPADENRFDPNVTRSENFTLKITDPAGRSQDKPQAKPDPGQNGKNIQPQKNQPDQNSTEPDSKTPEDQQGEPEPDQNKDRNNQSKDDAESKSDSQNGDSQNTDSQTGEPRDKNSQNSDSQESNSQDGSSEGSDSQGSNSQGSESQPNDSQNENSSSSKSNGDGSQSSGSESSQDDNSDSNSASGNGSSGQSNSDQNPVGSQSGDHSSNGDQNNPNSSPMDSGNQSRNNGSQNNGANNASNTNSGSSGNPQNASNSSGGNDSPDENSAAESGGTETRDEQLNSGEQKPLSKDATQGEQMRRLEQLLNERPNPEKAGDEQPNDQNRSESSQEQSTDANASPDKTGDPSNGAGSNSDSNIPKGQDSSNRGSDQQNRDSSNADQQQSESPNSNGNASSASSDRNQSKGSDEQNNGGGNSDNERSAQNPANKNSGSDSSDSQRPDPQSANGKANGDKIGQDADSRKSEPQNPNGQQSKVDNGTGENSDQQNSNQENSNSESNNGGGKEPGKQSSQAQNAEEAPGDQSNSESTDSQMPNSKQSDQNSSNANQDSAQNALTDPSQKPQPNGPQSKGSQPEGQQSNSQQSNSEQSDSHQSESQSNGQGSESSKSESSSGQQPPSDGEQSTGQPQGQSPQKGNSSSGSQAGDVSEGETGTAQPSPDEGGRTTSNLRSNSSQGGKGMGAQFDLERDKLNLEHSKKATDLILNRLNDQKYNPDPKLLEQMNWTKEELNQFLARWQEMKQAAEKGDPLAGKRYEQMLRSLDFRAPSESRTVRQSREEIKGLNQDSAVIQPPPEFAPDFNATLRDLNRNN